MEAEHEIKVKVAKADDGKAYIIFEGIPADVLDGVKRVAVRISDKLVKVKMHNNLDRDYRTVEILE